MRKINQSTFLLNSFVRILESTVLLQSNADVILFTYVTAIDACYGMFVVRSMLIRHIARWTNHG